jgi:hypothetical protein
MHLLHFYVLRFDVQALVRPCYKEKEEGSEATVINNFLKK